MTAWRDVEAAEPEFARRVRTLFDAHRRKTIATVRRDGSPRISGIEAVFEDGELVFGSMPTPARARTSVGISGSHCTAPRSTRCVVPRRSGRARRRSPAGRSLPDRSPKHRTPTASAPTSPRSCIPTSMRRPRCWSSNGGRPSTGCEALSVSEGEVGGRAGRRGCPCSLQVSCSASARGCPRGHGRSRAGT